MELKKALKILNLSENYTESELKKAHRKLALQYHPDKNPNNEHALKMTKEINEARDILKKHLKNNNPSYNKKHNSSNNQTSYKKNNSNQEFINILKKLKKEIEEESYTIYDDIDPNDNLFIRHKDKFTNILYKYSCEIIPAINDLELLKITYTNFRKEYQNALVDYYIDFSKITNIDNDMWTIHYCDTLKEVRNCMIISIDDKLTLELNKYSNHKYFKELLPLLNKIKKNYRIDCLYGHGSIKNIQNNFSNTIVLEFKRYERRKKLLDELKSDPVMSILPITIELEYVILSEEKFYNIYSQINTSTKIKCKIKRIFKKKSNLE